MTCSANVGVSWMRKRNVLWSITASFVSTVATARRHALGTIDQGHLPERFVRPDLEDLAEVVRSSISPSITPYISDPAPCSKRTVPAATFSTDLALWKTPGTGETTTGSLLQGRRPVLVGFATSLMPRCMGGSVGGLGYRRNPPTTEIEDFD